MMSAQLNPPPGSALASATAGAQQPTAAESSSPGTDLETSAPPLRNRAGDSKNPFVRAHTDTLVHWQLLDDEALARAKAENKLIFLTIGFLASHYCHLTRQDSFCNPRIANILNEHFIPIIVDREERPDIDTIYMNYNLSLNSGGGWPLNMFLTPDLEPVFGGTYWTGPGVHTSKSETDTGDEPLEFLVILQKLLSVWPEEEVRVRDEAKKSVIELRRFSGEGTLNADSASRQPSQTVDSEFEGEVDLDQIEEAYTRIAATFDPMCGGFGQEPKFPTSAKLSTLLRATQFPKEVQDVVGAQDCGYVSTMALHTLRRMIAGGMHDHVGGGFHRLSVTRDWSLPSFEKLLIDNSLLLGVFLDAWLLVGGTEQSEFASTVIEVADYITSDRMISSTGGFVSSEAADSVNKKGDSIMQQGAFYLWTRKEFDSVIGDEQESEVAAAYWDVQEHGNVDRSHDPHDEFLNQNVLRIVRNHARLTKQLGLSDDDVPKIIASAREKLRAFRDKERVQPAIDTKVVTAYNGMAIAALARTALALRHTGGEFAAKGETYLAAAKKAAEFIKTQLWDASSQVLYRVWADGRSDTRAFADDYAYLIEASLELYEATSDESWLQWADELQAVQIKLFYDSVTPSADEPSASRCGAFYSTTSRSPHAILRVKDAMDSAQPSVNAVSASNLFRLGALLGDKKYSYLAKETVNAFGVEMLEHPHLFPGLLCGVVSWRLGASQLVSISHGPASKELAKFFKAPRASLSTLLYLGGPSSWLRSRNPALGDVPQETGLFVLENGSYRRHETAGSEPMATDSV
ncbi:Six-hairpin glycosidase-like protein [Microdochium trichocladiopsis]|uniref:Six-hairpin glycosidase-like protein n=1 Tax=Microdochium trichocladiopsis TaxID=1682393 RepID=A0A9P8YD35_9PEZI|nr:Six-hairpin glycosidase-like protein [Microdochium trichocladiopsis]KAH7037250.1 Six-hairpin glycosidase-like protein [Microdochium trichocladiopsis]